MKSVDKNEWRTYDDMVGCWMRVFSFTYPIMGYGYAMGPTYPQVYDTKLKGFYSLCNLMLKRRGLSLSSAILGFPE